MRTIIIEVPVTVQNDEQVSKILESVRSGLAESAIKDRVLFSSESSPTSLDAMTPKNTIEREHEVQKPPVLEKEEQPLKSMTTEEITIKPISEPEPEKKSNMFRGIIGGRRLGRSGGGR